jgi:hypothetical protein
MIARIEGWREKARGRADADRVLGEAHKLFDELSNMLTELLRQLLGRGRQRRSAHYVAVVVPDAD